jgi:tRNA G18 (ribose-2'-O)-methylase SpoU
VKPIKLSPEDKNEKMFSWQYNVKDEFKNLSQEDIVSRLEETKQPFAVLMSHLSGDFNIATVIRNANAFNAKCVYYFGQKKYDRRGAVGTYKYLQVSYLNNIDDITALKEKYSFVCMENCPGSVSLTTFDWKLPKMPLIIIGEEHYGIPKEVIELADVMVEIPSFGSVRSMNAGCASGIAMYDFVMKHNC